MQNTGRFTVALASDFRPGDDPAIPESFGLGRLLAAPTVTASVLPVQDSIAPETAAANDALLLMDQHVTEETLAGSDRLRLVARYGVGTDSVDIDACTRHGVIVSVTPEGVTRPVASAALTLILATTHRLVEKTRILRSGSWANRGAVVGVGLTGRRIGIVGFGRTGRELARLLGPFGATLLAYDPYVSQADAVQLGVTMVGLDELFSDVDVVCLLAVLTPETHHLLNRERLASLRPDAIVVNVSRGGLIDEAALVDAISSGRIAGAGLDVYEHEPLAGDSPLISLAGTHNLVLTPHSLCWTDECFLGNGGSASQAVLDLAVGRLPAHIANPAVLEHPRVAGLLR